MASAARDRWAEWLAERRFGGDPEVRAEMLARLAETRDRVLDRARLRTGETLLDVGCGEGLIGFGALERGAGTVIFGDVSTDLLEFCREAATELGVLDRCRFVEAPADDLAQVDDESVDVVATRSVLVYVEAKDVAFGELARVLRPGGRISVWEPINRFGAEERRRGFLGYRAEGIDELAAKLWVVYEEIQPPDGDPMLDFDERDLLRLAEAAGFFPLRLTLDARIEETAPRSWEGMLDTASNPNVPTLREAMEDVLTPEERELLTERLRPLVEAGGGEWRMAFAHLSGTRR
ncbi:MAG TPA: methyltransferase domain-containing protein [Gaiellaceae bacterium]|nr:methyltransferase domain-containing protein [Gaiellaceae bacterium]